MYHCDITSEIILTCLKHWFYFFREAIKPFVLQFYIWGILLFETHWWWLCFTSYDGWKLLLSKAALFLFLIFESISGLFQFFFQESLQGISEETCRKFLALGFMTTYAPLLHFSKSVEVNSVKWCQEALTEHTCPLSVCSSSFLPCKPRNWAMLHYAGWSYVRATKNGQCLLCGGWSVSPEIWNFYVWEGTE